MASRHDKHKVEFVENITITEVIGSITLSSKSGHSHFQEIETYFYRLADNKIIQVLSNCYLTVTGWDPPEPLYEEILSIQRYCDEADVVAAMLDPGWNHIDQPYTKTFALMNDLTLR